MIKFPPIPALPKVPALGEYLRDFSQKVANELSKRTPDDTTRQRVLLTSTNDASVWEITVNNVGTITATKVSG